MSTRCSNGSVLYTQQNGLAAIHLASKVGHANVVAELLRRGAPVDSLTKVR